jgi:uncharacterized membrane protein
VKLHFVAYVMPMLIIGVALPMAFAIVPPNQWYGFRTTKTLSSPRIWYAANRASGWFMIGAASVALCVHLALWSVHPEWPEKKLVFWMANSMVISLLLALIPSFLYLRRL